MLIQAPGSFQHAGNIAPGLLGDDPRNVRLHDEVVIDLRYCEFVRPPAALWCLVYALLVAHRGQKCTVTVPEDIGVARYLKTIGLFDLLVEGGVHVDDRGVAPSQGDQIGVRLQRFSTEFDIERIANDATNDLSARDLGAANIRPVVIETFSELAMNAVQHSESPIGSFGMVQFYRQQDDNRFLCVVADGGIGIRKHLEKNPQLRQRVFYDWSAIELALGERVSGTGGATRGIGLHYISQEMGKPGRQLIIHSGQGIVTQREDLQRDAKRGTLFPGTLAYAAIIT